METNPKPYFLRKLESEFARRQRANPSYSLRSFARQLTIHAGTLSSVLKGARPLPFKKALAVSKKLALTSSEASWFLSSARNQKISLRDLSKEVPSDADLILRDESHYQIISEWEHYALLSLVRTQGFKANPKWIAGRLGISEARAKEALGNLLKVGLLKDGGAGTIERAHDRIDTTTEKISAALRDSHKETLRLAEKRIDEVPIEYRGYYSETVAINPARMNEAKALIQEFRSKLSAYLEAGEPTEVYQIGLQIFPLTQMSFNKEMSHE